MKMASSGLCDLKTKDFLIVSYLAFFLNGLERPRRPLRSLFQKLGVFVKMASSDLCDLQIKDFLIVLYLQFYEKRLLTTSKATEVEYLYLSQNDRKRRHGCLWENGLGGLGGLSRLSRS